MNTSTFALRLASFSALISWICSASSFAMSHADFVFEQGDVLARKNQFHKALPYLDRAIELNDHVARYYAERGWVLLELEQRDRALSDLNTSLKLDPNQHSTTNLRTRCNYEMGNAKAALADANRTLALNHGDKTADYKIRADMYLLNNEPNKALDDMTTAIKLSPNKGWLYYDRGKVQLVLHHKAAAVADFASAIKSPKLSTGELSRIYSVKATTLEQMGRLKEAQADRQAAEKFARMVPTYDIWQPNDNSTKP